MERYNFHELYGGAAKDKLNLIELRLLATWEGGGDQVICTLGYACAVGVQDR